MRKVMSIVVAVVLLCGSLPVYAAQVVIDLEYLDASQKATVLELEELAHQKKITEQQAQLPQAQQMAGWVDVGEKVGKAIAATCKELGEEVNTFVRTPVGVITVSMITWKVVGKDLWSIIGGIMAWCAVTFVLWRSFNKFHIPERIEKDGEIKYIAKYDFKSGEARNFSAFFHAASFIAMTVATMFIVFY